MLLLTMWISPFILTLRYLQEAFSINWSY